MDTKKSESDSQPLKNAQASAEVATRRLSEICELLKKGEVKAAQARLNAFRTRTGILLVLAQDIETALEAAPAANTEG